MNYLFTFWALLLFVTTFLMNIPLIYIFSIWGDQGRKASWLLIKIWSKIWCFASGLWVRVKFEERPDSRQHYIFVANHASFLDTPLIFNACPQQAYALASDNFAKIPLFGYMYRQMAIMVNRKDTQSRHDSYLRMRKALEQEGKSLWIFPEGKINLGKETLQAFYDGAFRLAVETGTPIVPIVFFDSGKRWPISGFWTWNPGLCRIKFLKVITKEEIGQTTVEALKERVHQQIEQSLIAVRQDASAF